jgi:hypothetical protein
VNKFSNIFFVIVVLISSCGKAEEEIEILPKKRFTSLLIKMHILEADFSFNQQLDQKAMDGTYFKYAELFKAYKTDSTAVSNTFDYYSDKQNELLEIYREVLDSLNALALKDNPNKKITK